MLLPILRALLGVAFFLLIAWLLSSDRKRFPWRVVAWGLGLQLVLALLVLKTQPGFAVFEGIGNFFLRLLDFSEAGASVVFGELAIAGQAGYVLAFAGKGLIAILFLSALMAVLYQLGVIQCMVWALARIMAVTMRVSGAESLAMAANVFSGQTEAPLVVRQYLQGMTRSELNAMMTGGFATIAGSVLAIYAGIVGPDYTPHLIAASVMSAPAAFMIAKVILPETDRPATAGQTPFVLGQRQSNIFEAAAVGTQDGLRLWLNVVAMLIAFTALIAFIDWPLSHLGTLLGLPLTATENAQPLSLALIFGYALAPVAWLMGTPWDDCLRLGGFLGIKITLNEFVAFTQMQVQTQGENLGFNHKQSAQIAIYALTGFANFASIGIQIGGLAVLIPDRRSELARLGLKAMVGGAMASWLTATLAGAML